MALSRTAHERRQHEAAYHALTAAMHAASDDNDHALLEAIAGEAQTQITWIDRYEAAHRLSTHSSQRRGHPGVYAMLTRDALIHADLLKRRIRHAATGPVG